MFKLLKNILVQLRNGSNRISYNSDIATDVLMGKENQIRESRIYSSTIQNNCEIKKSSIFSSSLGDHVKIVDSNLFSAKLGSNVSIDVNSTISGSSVKHYTYFAGNNLIFNSTIGAYCSIAGNVNIGHAEHPYHHFSTSPVFYKKNNPFGVTQFVDTEISEFSQTTIGNDVWIGLNAYIKSGVTVGDGSIIGAGSIVTKDVPAYGIVAGVPAKLIKMRFDDETILRLKKDAWWDLSTNELLEYKKRNW